MGKFLTILGLLFFLNSCRSEIPDNCEGQYSFKRQYLTSFPQGKLKIGDTLLLKFDLPINVYNFSSDSIVNINRFNRVLCGFTVDELIPDSINGVGIKSVHAKNEFKYNSPNVLLDFSEGVGGRNRVRYYLKKADTAFVATIQIIPVRKGLFNLQLLSGIIDDAFCRSGIITYWSDSVLFYSFENYKIILESFEINRTIEELDFFKSSNTTNYYFFIE